MKYKNIITGYKCFDKGLTNRYGKKFEINKLYHCPGEIKFGNHGNGFHMCARLEDTLKFFDCKNSEVDIAKVTCFGEYDEIPATYESEYAGDYDMYAYEYMIIDKILTREEIIEYILSTYPERVNRFLMHFKLTEDEKELFYTAYKDNVVVLQYLDYYQNNDKDAFKKRRVIR